MIALLIAAMGFAQTTKVLATAQNMEKQKVAIQNKKFISGNHAQTRNTRALECADDALFSTVDLDACQSAGTSNTNAGYLHAMRVDGFTLPLASIRFFGAQMLYSNGWTEVADVETLNFNIKIYEDDNNMPGTVVETVSGVALTHTATTDLLFDSYSIFQFDYTFATPVDVPSTFWIEISNTDENVWFMWLDNESGDFTSAAYDADEDEWEVSTDAAYQICLIPQVPANATIVAMPTSLSFNGIIGNEIAAKTVTIATYNLTTAITATTSAPFAVSNDGTTYAETAEISENGGTLYVKYTPTVEGTQNGTVVLASTGAENVTIALTGSAIDCSNPITALPFEEGFENMSGCWTLISNNAANAGEFGVYQVAEDNMVFRFSSYDEADDYTQILITPELNLAAENTRLTFDYAKSSGSGEKFIVMVSSTDNDTAHFTMLGDTVSAASTSFEQYSSMIPAGTKYIAIKYVSSYMYRLYVDNFKLEEVFANDIAVVNAEFTNMPSCEIESSNLNVTVRNNGLSNITAFSIEYSINEGTPAVINVADTVIIPDSTFVVTIEDIDVSTAGTTYNVAITATLEGDENTENNTGAASIRHTTPSALPFVESFDEGLDNYNIINADEDEATWNVANVSGTDYALYIADDEADDYILTNCINFEEANIYEISFDYLGGYNYYDYFMFYDNIEILYGTSQDVEEMTVIDSIVDIYEPAFVEYNKRFTIATAGTYYFAIHCYSEDGARVAINNLKINMIDPYEASISNLTFGTP